MRRIISAIFVFMLAFVFLVRIEAAALEEAFPTTMRRTHDPVQVPGEMLKDLHGKNIDCLRLFAYSEGEIRQAVFQIDERLADGTFVMDMGEGANPMDHNFILDPQDLLVFRISDTGGRAPKNLWPAQEGVEIELEDPVDGGRSWCYLLYFDEAAPPRLEIDTVSLEHWDPWAQPELPFIVSGMSFTIEGFVNKVHGRFYKTAVNKSFKVPPSAGGTGVNILDGQKMRPFIELLFGKIKIEFNETNMIGGIDSIVQGKVRGYGRQWMTIALPFDLEASRLYSDVFTYDRIIVSPMQLNMPFNPRSIITRAGIEFGYDLNEAAYGMRFYSPNCMDGVTIDGKITEKEKGIPGEWVPWFLITGPQASLIFRVDVDPALMHQTKNTLTYIDDRDKAFPPEEVPGSIGYAQTIIVMESVKAGHYNFSIEWYFPPNFYKPGGYDKKMLQEFLNIKDAPLIIRVGKSKTQNSSLSPPPLLPRK